MVGYLDMKVAIPTMDRNGMNAEVGAHFGRSPTFTIVDTETGEADTIDNVAEHFGGRRKTPELLQEADVDAVLCSAVGPRAIHAFQNMGIHVFVGASGTVESAVEDFKSGGLKEATDADACDQHRRG